MGTPDFAVPALKALRNHNVVGVFCQPDRPRGRSKKLMPCPVKEAALEMDIPVHQPKRIKARKWVSLLRELEPDLVVVAAFGQILSQAVLDVPKIDCINIHASLLPRWRGASPIHHAILHGDARTGVGIMKMVLALDAGPVYAEADMPIPETMGRLELEQKLADMGAELLLETIPKLENLTPVPQAEEGLTYAPIIKRDFGFVDFHSQSAIDIERMTRAYEGWPQAQCLFRSNPAKLLEVEALKENSEQPPGTIVRVTKKELIIACTQGSLSLKTVQPAGKKPQPAAAFINGYKPLEGECFTGVVINNS